jgi:fumarate reductase subunit D
MCSPSYLDCVIDVSVEAIIVAFQLLPVWCSLHRMNDRLHGLEIVRTPYNFGVSCLSILLVFVFYGTFISTD